MIDWVGRMGLCHPVPLTVFIDALQKAKRDKPLQSHTPETATVDNIIVKNNKLIYICQHIKATPQRQLL